MFLNHLFGDPVVLVHIYAVCLFQCILIFGCYPKIIYKDKRLIKNKWLTSKAYYRYLKLLVYLYDHRMIPKHRLKMIYHLKDDVVKKWTLSGITFTISYYSEVLRLVLQFLNYKGKWHFSPSIWVATHRRGKRSQDSFYGLPKILSYQTKVFLVNFRRRLWAGNLPRIELALFKLIVSGLAFFRATSPDYSKPKFTTITDPFCGESEQLPEKEIRKALKDLGIVLKVGKPNPFWLSTKSGPNFNVATLGAGLDLLAWMGSGKWLNYFQFCIKQQYWLLASFFLITSIGLFPIFIVYQIIPRLGIWSEIPISSLVLGRISILDEARGKKRLIGITDYWTQVLFRPLHDAIYAELGKIPQDGTSDQMKPIRFALQMLEVHNLRDLGNKRVQSLDLSAATDRLPIKLQVQILRTLGYPGDVWKDLLDREWSSDAGTLRYAVGQPMGAYSSFAMLALTHHVIVRIAAQRAGLVSYKLLYAVLGDDGFMANEKVARHYKDIFHYLGMPINPIKGFEGTILEFAKQLWSINRVNLSPLGPKNILLSIRHPEFITSILFEMIVKQFPLFLNINKKVVKASKVTDHRSRALNGAPIPELNFANFDGCKPTYPNTSITPNPGNEPGNVLRPYLKINSKMVRTLPVFDAWLQSKRDQQMLKRRTDDTLVQIPLVTAKSVFKLVNVLFFRSKEGFDSYKYNKTWFTVLMTIGPMSGLWSIDHKLAKHLVGPGIYNFFKRMFLTSMHLWLNPNMSKRDRAFASRDFLRNLKSTYEGRIYVVHKMKYALVDLWKSIRAVWWMQPSVGWKETKSRWFSLYDQALLSLTNVVTVTNLIFLYDSFIKFMDVMRACWDFMKMRFYQGVYYYYQYGLSAEAIYVFSFVLFLTHDVVFTLYWSVPIFLAGGAITSPKVRQWVLNRVYFNPEYGFPGDNAILDNLSKPFDPFTGSNETILNRLSEPVANRSDVAFKNLVIMLRFHPKFRAFHRKMVEVPKESRGIKQPLLNSPKPPKPDD